MVVAYPSPIQSRSDGAFDPAGCGKTGKAGLSPMRANLRVLLQRQGTPSAGIAPRGLAIMGSGTRFSGTPMPDHIGLKRCGEHPLVLRACLGHKSQGRERPMMRLKAASLAILGTAAIAISVLASPAMAEGKMAKGTMAKGAKYAQAQPKGSQTLAKGPRHAQRHATYQSKRFRNANAALPGGTVYRRPAGPAEVAGNVVGGAVATAGAIATAPFRAFDNSNYNYYGYGYGGRDWKTYAAHNGLACTPGTTFKGPDGRKHLCQ
jgi:hypothetical protein